MEAVFMSDDNEIRVFTPANLLRAKVGNKPGPDLDQIVAKAEAALTELQAEYEIWIREDLKSLRNAAASLRLSFDPKTLDRIMVLSHEIKGQGATYGYPLLTTVGDLLYRFIAQDKNVAAKHLDLIDAHVNLMALVLNEKINDESGIQAQSILAGLQEATRKAHGGGSQTESEIRSGT
jgi:hypothetical protein